MPREEPRPDDITTHIRQTLDHVHPDVSRYTYPLFSIDTRNQPDLHASCVVVECDRVPILLTAAHAVASISNSGSFVHFGAKRIVPLPDRFVLSSVDGNDPFDIAAMELSEDMLKQDAIEVLPMVRTTIGREFSSFHLRCIHGYPCSKNRQPTGHNARARIFSKFGLTYAGSSPNSVAYTEYGKSEKIHVALEYGRISQNANGERVTPPKPKGFSGGGLWITPNSLTPDRTYLEGIAIEHHKRGALVFATRIQYAYQFVRQHVLSRRRSRA